jgi:phage shock protein B
MTMAWIEAPLIVFLVIVVPIWLVLHYRSKRHLPTVVESGGADAEVVELWQTARRMEERIRTLERILDADTPNWRGRT